MGHESLTIEADNNTRVNEVGFVSAFQSIAAYYGRPTSQTALFSGSPIDLKNPTVEEIERVAARIGLEISNPSKKLTKVTKSDLPALVIDNNGEMFALIEELTPGLFKTNSKHGEESQQISRADLGEIKTKDIITFSALYLNSSDRADVGGAHNHEKEHWLRGTLSVFWKSYLNVVIAALFINFIGLVTPIFVMNVYDRILPNQAISSLWVLGVGVIIALIFDLLLKTSRSAIIDHTGRVADQKLAYLLFEKVLNSKLSNKPASTGEFASRIGQYEFVREFFTSNTLSVLIDSAFIFIFLGVIYLIAGWVAIVPAIAFVLTILVGLFAQQRIKKRVTKAANEAAQRNALLVETVTNIENVKTLRAEALFLRKWSELTKNASKTSENIKQISAGAANSTQFMQQMVTVGIVISGAYAFSAGEITTGAIIASVMLAGRAVAPLGQIAMTLARLHQAMLSLRILDGIMDQPDDLPQTTSFVNRQIKSGNLELKALDFTYPETDHPVISNLSLSIKAGEKVGIIGKIGSGKTTLARLLCSLYQPTGGHLLIDGVDVRQYHPHEVRKAVSLAGQTADLFTGTLKENLLLAKPNATDEEIISVSKKTGVDDFAARHPRGYDMPVGERGDKLSGGQKQAVVIARLLLTDPSIIFLDEPSGSMDMASERVLLKTLATAFKPETTLLISTHRYSLLELIDRLIVLDNGRLVADGPKAVVMQQLAQRAQAANSEQKAMADL